MDFSLTKEQELIKKTIREFALNEVKPFAKEADAKERFIGEFGIIDKLSKLGIMGMSIPKEYGGTNLPNVTQTIIMEELSKVCASTAVTMGAHTSLSCYPIVNYGSEELKKKYLPKLASGEWLGAFALTEPNAGSDASNVETTAKLIENEWVLNGSKVFITNGGKANLAIIVATTDKALGYKGLNMFAVETKTPGFIIGKKENKLGLRGSNTTEIFLKDVKIPKENLIGKEGNGFRIAMAVFDSGRIGIGIQGVGIAQGALDECITYAKERKQFGRAIHKFQMIQYKLSQMQCEIDAARLLCLKAAYLKDTKQKYSMESAMAKLYGSQISMNTTREAIQILGGYGYSKDYPVERFFRDAKITEIYEGTSEIQRIVISNNLMGKMW